jgi:hypothetical protein
MLVAIHSSLGLLGQEFSTPAGVSHIQQVLLHWQRSL